MQARGPGCGGLQVHNTGFELKVLPMMNYDRQSASCLILNALAISIDHSFTSSHKGKMKWEKNRKLYLDWKLRSLDANTVESRTI